jgi:hypothetical protein
MFRQCREDAMFSGWELALQHCSGIFVWQEVGNKVKAYFYVTAFRQCVLRHDYNYRIYI